MTRTSTRNATIPAARAANARVSPAIQVLRQFVVREMAKKKMPTTEIADRLGVSRSFVIKQAHIRLRAVIPAEKRVLKAAAEFEHSLRRAGVAALMGGTDIITELAGGPRPKLGPLAERRAKSAKSTPRIPRVPKVPKVPKVRVPKTPAAPKAPKVPKVPAMPKIAENPPLSGSAFDRMLGAVAVKHDTPTPTHTPTHTPTSPTTSPATPATSPATSPTTSPTTSPATPDTPIILAD
jgi:hypothetical protein